MSFEGYYQCLCGNGHFWCESARYAFEKDLFYCPHCYKSAVWSSLVDETNGGISELSRRCPGDMESLLLLIFSAKTKKCACCGHVRKIEAARYLPPTKAWVRKQNREDLENYREPNWDSFAEDLIKEAKKRGLLEMSDEI